MSDEQSTDTPDPENENMGWVHDTERGYRDPLWPDGKIPSGEGTWVDDTKLNRVALKLDKSDDPIAVERVRGKGVLIQLGTESPKFLQEEHAKQLFEKLQAEF